MSLERVGSALLSGEYCDMVGHIVFTLGGIIVAIITAGRRSGSAFEAASEKPPGTGIGIGIPVSRESVSRR